MGFIMSEKNFFQAKQSLNIKGRLLDLSSPKVMGILNVTPDSFYNKSRTETIEDALRKVEQFLKEGATFIDIGGYSSRPGAKDISADEELERLIPVVESIANNFPEAIMSIDTFRARVAQETILAGAHVVNDIASGDMDDEMLETIAKLQVPYIFMHMQGTPQTMQQSPVYNNVLLDIVDYFSRKVEKLRILKIHDVILDPGFGFGKTIAHNYELLNKMEDFQIFGLPILVGFSRKGMIYKPLEISASEALNGTTVLHTIALQKGAKILRVHDVKEAVECVKLISLMV